jgi:serine kinase of HPr protein (carbohydrate metabolism regulator)
MQIEATAVSLDGRAVLLTGRSGAGKSDLALRLIRSGAVLIGDDAVRLSIESGALLVGAVAAPTARVAVRGLGFVPQPTAPDPVPLSLCIALTAKPITAVDPVLSRAGPWHDRYVPEIALYPFEASAADKVLLAVERFGL